MIIQKNLRESLQEPVPFGHHQTLDSEVENLIYSFIVESHQSSHALIR
jgi:hypothetical protein